MATVAQSLRFEIDNHEPRIMQVAGEGRDLVMGNFERSDEILDAINRLVDKLGELRNAVGTRQQRLDTAERRARLAFDSREAESWIYEQDLILSYEVCSS